MDGPRDCHAKWSQRKTNTIDVTYMWDPKKKKKDTNELTYEAEMDSQTWKIKVHYQRGNVREEG